MFTGMTAPTTSRTMSLRTAGVVLLALGILALTFIGLARHSSDVKAPLPPSNRRLGRVPSFDVEFGEPVAMRITASARYAIDTAEGAEEWAKLLPPTGHLVHLPSSSSSANITLKPYTVTLFHQLSCLDIIRQQYLLPQSAPISKETEHCMNYLRQTVLCRANTWLESAKNVVGTASRAYDAVCRDWHAVYEAAERNRKEMVEFGFADYRAPRRTVRTA